MRKDAEEFLKAAEDDLLASEELFRNGRYRIVAFHAQQAAEKYLKAYLLEKTENYPFTHSISDLIELCSHVDGDFEHLFDIRAHTLEEYYTHSRYPPVLEISEDEAREAIRVARAVGEFVRKKLSMRC